MLGEQSAHAMKLDLGSTGEETQPDGLHAENQLHYVW